MVGAKVKSDATRALDISCELSPAGLEEAALELGKLGAGGEEALEIVRNLASAVGPLHEATAGFRMVGSIVGAGGDAILDCKLTLELAFARPLSMLDLPVRELGLSHRTSVRCEEAGAFTIRDLINRTPSELQRSLGQLAYVEVLGRLAAEGLHLKRQDK